MNEELGSMRYWFLAALSSATDSSLGVSFFLYLSGDTFDMVEAAAAAEPVRFCAAFSGGRLCRPRHALVGAR